MKINKIPARFLQFILLAASAVFTSKTVSAENKTAEDKSTINDRINLVRERLRNNLSNEELSAMDVNRSIKTPPVDQIWINIVPSWNDWNKLWNDWANWNNWSKWNDWGNFHRDHDHDRGHDHDKDHGRK
jgi:hypothetical protein